MSYQFEQHRITGGIGADDGYWAGLEEGEFRLPRCPACRTWRWPAHFRCAECGGWDQEWVAVEPTGVVYSWTRTHLAFDRTTERAPDVPYTVVLTEIPHAGGARVLGVLAGANPPRIGAPVRGHIDPPSDKSMGYPAIRWEVLA
ncbi:MAG TPA: OB-fold domain-containing protein [Pseudonocardia sp.]|jgi:hypothetical protein